MSESLSEETFFSINEFYNKKNVILQKIINLLKLISETEKKEYFREKVNGYEKIFIKLRDVLNNFLEFFNFEYEITDKNLPLNESGFSELDKIQSQYYTLHKYNSDNNDDYSHAINNKTYKYMNTRVAKFLARNDLRILHRNLKFQTKRYLKKYNITRAWIKIWEIVYKYDLINSKNSKFKFFSFAEAPGNFIDSILTYIEKNKIFNLDKVEWKSQSIKINEENDVEDNGRRYLTDQYNLMSGEYKDNWDYGENVKFKKKHKVKFLYGNLELEEMILYYYEKYKNTYNLVTGDGGINTDYEEYQIKGKITEILISSEILLSIALCKKGGHIVVKIYDIFNSEKIMKCISICSKFFKNVYITKTSAGSRNSIEKYLVCKDKIPANKVNVDLDKIIKTFARKKEINHKLTKKFLSKIYESEIVFYQFMTLNIILIIFYFKLYSITEKETDKRVINYLVNNFLEKISKMVYKINNEWINIHIIS